MSLTRNTLSLRELQHMNTQRKFKLLDKKEALEAGFSQKEVDEYFAEPDLIWDGKKLRKP